MNLTIHINLWYVLYGLGILLVFVAGAVAGILWIGRAWSRSMGRTFGW